MNFDVDVKLQAAAFSHTAFPVLLASNDWHNWFQVADRSHAHPQPYFAGQSSVTGIAYKHVTTECTRPPDLISNEPVDLTERYNSAPTYLLVCVTWNHEKASLHRGAKRIAGGQLADYCDAIGGACGWPCGSSPSDTSDLPGCSNSKLNVNAVKGLVAGHAVPFAEFSGDVSVRACTRSPGSDSCIASDLPLSRWPCHKCRNTTEVENNSSRSLEAQELTLEYDSLPPIEVVLQDVHIEKHLATAMDPQAFVLTSPLAKNGKGPAAMQLEGSW